MEEKALACPPQRYPKISNDLLKAAHQSSLMEMKLLILAISKLPQDKNAEFEPLTPIYITRDDALQIGFNPKNLARDLRSTCSSLRHRDVVLVTPLGEKETSWIYNILFFKEEIFKKLKEKYPNSKYDDEFINQLRLHNLLDALPLVMKSDESLMARIIIHPDVLPFLVQLSKSYTQPDLMELAKLTDSVYSLRIFLLMMQWKDTGVVHKKLDDLRKEFKLENKYPLTADIRRWVIETAVDEINEKSSYQVEYALEKTGRKFTHLRLNFHKKQQEKSQSKPIQDSTAIDFGNLTDAEREIVAKAEQYADSIKAVPLHRKRLINKALVEHRKAEQEELQRKQAEEHARSQAELLERKQKLLEQQAKEDEMKLSQERLERFVSYFEGLPELEQQLALDAISDEFVGVFAKSFKTARQNNTAHKDVMFVAKFYEYFDFK